MNQPKEGMGNTIVLSQRLGEGSMLEGSESILQDQTMGCWAGLAHVARPWWSLVE